MSEIKDYGEMKPFFFYKNGHLDGESPSPIWGENENHAWNTHLEDLGVSREELEGEGYTLIEYRAELDNTKRDRIAWLLEQVDSFLCDPTSGVKLDRLTIAYENVVGTPSGEITSVNALAGRDPAKLDALVEAVKDYTSKAANDYVTLNDLNRMANALAAFEGNTPPEVSE